jgi:hypothetical protein
VDLASSAGSLLAVDLALRTLAHRVALGLRERAKEEKRRRRKKKRERRRGEDVSGRKIAKGQKATPAEEGPDCCCPGGMCRRLLGSTGSRHCPLALPFPLSSLSFLCVLTGQLGSSHCHLHCGWHGVTGAAAAAGVASASISMARTDEARRRATRPNRRNEVFIEERRTGEAKRGEEKRKRAKEKRGGKERRKRTEGREERRSAIGRGREGEP